MSVSGRFGLALCLLAWMESGARAEEVTLLPPALGTSQLYAADARSGLGLAGYDPVSLWLGPTPRRGAPAFELAWEGLAWRFASEANLAAFRRDPSSFLPRLGGYDAAGIAAGRLATADPTIWLVREDRLYLFRSAQSRDLFAARPDLAQEAEARWPDLRAGAVKD